MWLSLTSAISGLLLPVSHRLFCDPAVWPEEALHGSGVLRAHRPSVIVLSAAPSVFIAFLLCSLAGCPVDPELWHLALIIYCHQGTLPHPVSLAPPCIAAAARWPLRQYAGLPAAHRGGYINFLSINQKCPLQEMSLQRNTVDLCRNDWPWLTDSVCEGHESLHVLCPGLSKERVQPQLQLEVS